MTTLCIVTTEFIDSAVDEIRSADQVLAVTCAAMTALDEINISFMALEDFYPWSQLEHDGQDMAADLVELLNQLDRCYSDTVKSQQSVSANGFWFLHRLGDMHYLQFACAEINRNFQHVVCICDEPVEPFPQANIDFLSLNLSTIGLGFYHCLQVFDLLLDCKYRYVESQSGNIARHPLKANETWKSLTRRLPDIILRRAKKKFSSLLARMVRKHGSFLVPQPGYEIDHIRNYCNQYRFLNTFADVRDLIAGSGTELILDTENTRMQTVIGVFAGKHMPLLEDWLNKLFLSYAENVISRIPVAQRILQGCFAQTMPDALLLSMGADNLLLRLYCDTAVQNNIPVFFFKHGGPENLFVRPTARDNYFERNSDIARVQFLHSYTELDLYKNQDLVTPVVLGRMERLPETSTKRKKHARTILFAMGPPAHFTYKDMTMVISDAERFQFVRSLVEFCNNEGVGLHIKPHPGDWQQGMRFVKKIIGRNPGGSVKIIEGGSVERSLPEYGAVILDVLRSKVLSAALTIDMPVITYLPTRLAANPQHIDDLASRVHLVQSPDQLKSLISQFSRQTLPSQWNKAFLDKYFGGTDTKKVLETLDQWLCHKK
jgi:hypothetical protein